MYALKMFNSKVSKASLVLFVGFLEHLHAADPIDVSLITNSLSTLSSQAISSISGVVSKVQCPSVRTGYDLGIDIPSMLDKVNMGNCTVGANAKTLNCLSSTVNGLGHGKYTFSPSHAFKRSGTLFEKLGVGTGCNYSPQKIASSTAVKQSGFMITSRVGERYRRCLSESDNCKINAFVLPENIEKAEADKNLAVVQTTGNHGRIFSGAFGQEQKVSNLTTSKCFTASCAGAMIQKSYEDVDSEDGEIMSHFKKSVQSESVLVEEATMGKYYFFDASEEARSMMPAQMKNEYLSGSYRASAAETFLNYHQYDLAQAQKELIHAQINKSKMASAPLLESNINQYISEVANAR